MRYRIVDRGQSRKISRTFRGGRNAKHVRQGFPDDLTFIVREEEGLVPDHRPSQSTSELILVKRRRGLAGGIKKVPGVKDIIPDEFVHVAMQCIRARLCDDIDDAAGFAAELRAVVGLVEIELPNIIERRV